MASVVEICNKALSLIGQKTIVSLEDDLPEAYACNTLWPTLRRKVLASHPWNCASDRIELNRLSEAPAFEFQYAFQLPSDYLRINEVIPEQEYSVEGKKVLANTSSLSIRYVKDLEDTTQYSPELTDALIYLLASELAYQMTSSTSLMAQLDQAGNTKLHYAKSSNSFEGRRRDTRQTTWLRARMGG